MKIAVRAPMEFGGRFVFSTSVRCLLGFVYLASPHSTLKTLALHFVLFQIAITWGRSE